MDTNTENTNQPPERRTRKAEREDIGVDKILDADARSEVSEKIENGSFMFRMNKALRNALGGEDNILSEDQRRSVLHTVYEAVKKFFHVGVARATEDESPKKQSFAERIRNEQKQKGRIRD